MMKNGKIYTMKCNRICLDYGQFVMKAKILTPKIPYMIRLLSMYNIQVIECGGQHVICMDINENLIVFGRNDVGQLGLGHNKDLNGKIEIEKQYQY